MQLFIANSFRSFFFSSIHFFEIYFILQYGTWHRSSHLIEMLPTDIFLGVLTNYDWFVSSDGAISIYWFSLSSKINFEFILIYLSLPCLEWNDIWNLKPYAPFIPVLIGTKRIHFILFHFDLFIICKERLKPVLFGLSAITIPSDTDLSIWFDVPSAEWRKLFVRFSFSIHKR